MFTNKRILLFVFLSFVFINFIYLQTKYSTDKTNISTKFGRMMFSKFLDKQQKRKIRSIFMSYDSLFEYKKTDKFLFFATWLFLAIKPRENLCKNAGHTNNCCSTRGQLPSMSCKIHHSIRRQENHLLNILASKSWHKYNYSGYYMLYYFLPTWSYLFIFINWTTMSSVWIYYNVIGWHQIKIQWFYIQNKRNRVCFYVHQIFICFH